MNNYYVASYADSMHIKFMIKGGMYIPIVDFTAIVIGARSEVQGVKASSLSKSIN